MATFLLIVGLGLFLGLVVAHELGHFIMARRGGVKVQEFGIGFPPTLFRRRTRAGWDFTINLLPLGGFVRLKGEHDTDNEAGSFGAASVGTKTTIILAGVTVNLIAAYLLLVILAMIGLPQLIDHQYVVSSDTTYVQRAHQYVAADIVEAGSPAAQAGVHPDDALLAIGVPGHLAAINDPNKLPMLTKQYAGQTVELDFRHGANGAVERRDLTLRSEAEVARAKQTAGRQEGYLGLSSYRAQDGLTIVRSTWSAPIVAAGVMKQFTVLTFEGLGKALAGLGSIIAGSVTGNQAARQAGQAQASSQVAGPVGIFFVFKYGSALGIRYVLLIVALLSLTLAIMNVLPIPALDGGRLWLMLLTRAVRRPLSPKHEEMVNATGFALIMALVVVITVVDVRRFF